MKMENTGKNLKDFLLNLQEEIVPLLSTISNPVRFKIIVLLLEKSYSFQELMERTSIQKSALANHLTLLSKKNLIKKVRHGIYEITKDGIAYLEAIETTFKGSQKIKKDLKEIEQRQKRSKIFLNRNKYS